MTYTEFADQFLVAAYQESRVTPNQTLRSGDILDRYPLTFEPGWVGDLVRDLGERAYLTSKGVDADERAQQVRLTGKGRRVAEDLIRKGITTLRLDLGDGIGFPPAQVHVPESDTKPALSGVDSSTWTGLPSSFQLSEERRQSLVSALDIVEMNLNNVSASQEVRAQARAYVIAAKSLSEAPDPPADVIWELVNRANSLAGIASLFVSILALFT